MNSIRTDTKTTTIETIFYKIRERSIQRMMPVRFLLPFLLERIYADNKSTSKERTLFDNVPRSITNRLYPPIRVVYILYFSTRFSRIEKKQIHLYTVIVANKL